MALQVRRGTNATFGSATTVLGELMYVTDKKRLYVGNSGTTKNYIGSPRRTEWAQCINTLTEDVCTATPVVLAWDTTASNVEVSDTALYTVATTGITVSYAGTYAIEANVAAKGASNSTSKNCELKLTVGGTAQAFSAMSVRDGTTYQTTNWKQIITLTAGQEVNIQCKRAGSVNGDVDIEAGKALIAITALEVDY